MRFKILAPILAVTLPVAGLSNAKDSPDQEREKSRKMAGSNPTRFVQAATHSQHISSIPAGRVQRKQMLLLRQARRAVAYFREQLRQDLDAF